MSGDTGAKNSPLVSVIIPAYNSEVTVAQCLDALVQQTYPHFETIIVDSSPNEYTAAAVRNHSADVMLVRSSTQLLPHAARNRGVQYASGELIVFTDPDIYPSTEWLEKMVTAHQRTGHVIVGSIECYGSHWLAVGMHLSKFDKWLPAGNPRPIDIGPTANMLCPEVLFHELGGFLPNYLLSDTLFSWQITESSHALWFTPSAVVFHHHTGSWDGLLRERYHRGKEFGYLRQTYRQWNHIRTLLQLIITLLPLRLVKLIGRIFVNTWRAGQTLDFWRTLPVLFTAQSAWLLGEATAYCALLIKVR